MITFSRRAADMVLHLTIFLSFFGSLFASAARRFGLRSFSVVCLVAWCQASWGADIRSTLHNLTRKGVIVEAEEVCVFCHTPQLSPASSVGGGVPAQPAWQPSLAVTHSYVMFDDIGRLQFGDRPAVGSQSIACLSCHDANQAFSVMSAEGDHPFGIRYRGFMRGMERTQLDDAIKEDAPSRPAKYLKSLNDFRIPSQGTVDNRSLWWVSASGVSAVRSRNDLPLYARPTTNGDVPYVECSSCHDPHIPNRLFLRVSNEGSRLCLTCHDK